MIASLPRPAWLRTATVLYVAAFMLFLFAPLVIVGVFAFNDANYPAPPWRGFTFDWFTGSAPPAVLDCSTIPTCWGVSGRVSLSPSG